MINQDKTVDSPGALYIAHFSKKALASNHSPVAPDIAESTCTAESQP